MKYFTITLIQRVWPWLRLIRTCYTSKQRNCDNWRRSDRYMHFRQNHILQPPYVQGQSPLQAKDECNQSLRLSKYLLLFLPALIFTGINSAMDFLISYN